jgi:hypothetical protein
MSAKKKLNEVTDPDFLAEIGCVPMTDEAISKMTMNPYDQLFLCSLMSRRDDVVKEDLKDFLQDLYDQDNDMICKNIAEIVTSQNKKMFEAFSEQNKLIGIIAKDIRSIKSDITDIKDRLEIIEDKVEEEEKRINDFDVKLKSETLRIETLEKEVKLLNPDSVQTLITEIEDITPAIDNLIKTQTWWNIGLRILVAVTISTIILIVSFQIHNRNSKLNDTKKKIEIPFR